MMKNSSNYLQLLSKWLSLLRGDQQKMKYSEIEKKLKKGGCYEIKCNN
jgi:hypothetical protein